MRERIKKWIIKLFKIETHSKELISLTAKYVELREHYNLAQDTIACYHRQIDEIEKEIERLEKLCGDPLERIKELEEEIETTRHRAFAEGRQSAYAEMGIKNIEAHERGNSLFILEDGKVVELITSDAVDVLPTLEVVADDEIVIEDLIDTKVE